MSSRFVPAVLIGLLVVLHAQLWFGRGSLPDVSRLQAKLATQKADNSRAQIANDRLAAEVRDLQEGMEMVEEKARLELGMVKPNEVLVQVAR
jgi:cell division protein FtsB